MNARDKELLDTVCEIVACEYREIPNKLRDQLEKAISDHYRESCFTHAQVSWNPEDVLSEARDLLDANLSIDQAQDFLEENSKYISEGMIETGWETIRTFLPEFISNIQAMQAESLEDRSAPVFLINILLTPEGSSNTTHQAERQKEKQDEERSERSQISSRKGPEGYGS